MKKALKLHVNDKFLPPAQKRILKEKGCLQEGHCYICGQSLNEQGERCRKALFEIAELKSESKKHEAYIHKRKFEKDFIILIDLKFVYKIDGIQYLQNIRGYQENPQFDQSLLHHRAVEAHHHHIRNPDLRITFHGIFQESFLMKYQCDICKGPIHTRSIQCPVYQLHLCLYDLISRNRKPVFFKKETERFYRDFIASFLDIDPFIGQQKVKQKIQFKRTYQKRISKVIKKGRLIRNTDQDSEPEKIERTQEKIISKAIKKRRLIRNDDQDSESQQIDME